MHVLATAGHVDHGKSTLVRALTGMEPDRLAEERRRGMTLDLGFAWMSLPNGQTVAFVDVPGHERFITTMLAGVGPVPAVLLAVAADGGWSAQTTEHVAILDSLGVGHGLLVVTRCDLADPAPVLADARTRLARTSLCGVEACAVSAVTGAGMAELTAAIRRLVERLPPPVTDGRIRLFIDRSFTVHGSGTVVTGTLATGRLAQDDRLELLPAGTEVRVRALQCLGKPAAEVTAVARVAVNLRGVAVDQVRRGDVLVTPRAWAPGREADVRLTALDPANLPGDLVLHIGSAAVACRLRPLGGDIARVTLSRPLPLQWGDRAVLRDPSRRVVTGLTVLDVDPPPLRGRGAARARAAALARATGVPDPRAEVARRGWVTRAHLAAIGVLDPDAPVPDGLVAVGEYLVDSGAWAAWGRALADAVDVHHAAEPLKAGLSLEESRRALGLPDTRLVEALVRAAGGRLAMHRGRITRPGGGPSFSPAVRAALDDIRHRLERDPFDAPQLAELAAAGLTRSILAAAAGTGMFLRLPGEVLVHHSAPDRAFAVIAKLPQPFTLSQARQALGTTRRVAHPLLEHLDATGRTTRVDGTLRQIRMHGR